ncbi:MAG: queuosine precursor transporter [Deltaproteobacteria bacterium]|nr:queuosine precursor transporter [Deltaproteobacteria bacterium]
MIRDIQFIKYIFVACLLLANIIASKIVVLGGLIVPAAIIVYPLTFLFTDVVAEVEGKKSAHRLVMTGFYLSLVMVVVLFIGKILPSAPFWVHQKSYDLILGATPRVVAASMIAYLVSQNHDVWAFHWWRKVTNGRHLWIRNNFSTIVSQLIDSILFIGLAFGGVFPTKTIIAMILGQYVIKVIIAILDTPFCYAFVSFYGKNRQQAQES